MSCYILPFVEFDELCVENTLPPDAEFDDFSEDVKLLYGSLDSTQVHVIPFFFFLRMV